MPDSFITGQWLAQFDLMQDQPQIRPTAYPCSIRLRFMPTLITAAGLGCRWAGARHRALMRWLRLCLVLIGLAALIGPVRAQAPGVPQVLALLSYHPQLPWTRALVAGLLDEAASQRVVLDLQVLDQQRAGTPELNSDHARLIIDRYRGRRPDVIIAESLPAVQFHARYLEAAMAGVPVVVLSEGSDRGQPGHPASEVAVETRLAETVDLAMALHRPTKAYLIGDQTPESQFNVDAMAALLAKWPGVRVERFDQLKLAEVAGRLAGLPKNESAVAFYGLIFNGGEDQPMPPAAALEVIAKSSRAPIYSFWDPMIGRGALGGYVTVPQQVGRQLLQEALRAAQAAQARQAAGAPRPCRRRRLRAAPRRANRWPARRWPLTPARWRAGAWPPAACRPKPKSVFASLRCGRTTGASSSAPSPCWPCRRHSLRGCWPIGATAAAR